MQHAEILHRCFRCGYCKLPASYLDINCPSYLKYRFESFSPGGRMWLLRAFLNGEIPASARLSEILFSCASCGNCTEQCVFPEFKDRLLEAFTAGRGELVNAGVIPSRVKDTFEATHKYGNAYGLPRDQRDRWAAGLDLEPYKGQEYLFHVGCAGSFDERGQQMARAVATLLKAAELSFGILGAAEPSDANEIHAMGEFELFELLAKQNIQQWRSAGAKKILTLSPHAYHAIKNLYPALNGRAAPSPAFEVVHYSQLLPALVPRLMAKDAAASADQAADSPLTVTFHDPCYLGRHNHEYNAPRLAIQSLPGLQLAEMQRCMADALCCGGGGGNFFTDVLGSGPNSPARVRVREALETGAQVLAVACPKCAKMLDDAIKAEDLEQQLQVADLTELITSRLSLSPLERKGQ